MTVILFDGNNLAMRAFLAPKRNTPEDEQDRETLILFVNMVSRYMKIERPTKGLFCWDSGMSAYRMRIYPKYKGNRKQKSSDEASPPFALMQEFLKLVGINQMQLPGYEGDDLIGASWRACRGRERIRIVSSDKDMFQLLEDGTEQLRLNSGSDEPDRWNRNKVITTLGFKPEHAVWVMSLMGDASDNIPGLPRVGMKTAVKRLREYKWDMSALLDSLPQDQQNQVLLNMALIDLSVVPLELDAPEEFDLVGPDHPKWSALEEFLDRHELTSIKGRLITDTLWH